MAKKAHLVTVAICTWRRPELLRRILGELHAQSLAPDRLVIVDGEGGSPDVRNAVVESGWPMRAETLLVPSSRPNLPFQRWLARHSATNCDILIFFDDDLLLPDPRTVERLASALEQASAATCQVRQGSDARGRFRWRTGALGPLRRLRAGKLGAGGSRYLPPAEAGPLAPVDWLRGAAMAFRTAALPPERFPRDLFALAETGAGMGEELALACRVRGRIVLVRDLEVAHPSGHPSRAVPAGEERQGFAIAYSRRLLHDLRQPRPTLFGWADLAVAWAGGLGAAVADCLVRGGADRIAFARGYARGVVRGVVRPPRHSRLTPGIDWEREAQISLDRAVDLTKEAACRPINA